MIKKNKKLNNFEQKRIIIKEKPRPLIRKKPLPEIIYET
jgi:hypothetical protein